MTSHSLQIFEPNGNFLSYGYIIHSSKMTNHYLQIFEPSGNFLSYRYIIDSSWLQLVTKFTPFKLLLYHIWNLTIRMEPKNCLLKWSKTTCHSYFELHCTKYSQSNNAITQKNRLYLKYNLHQGTLSRNGTNPAKTNMPSNYFKFPDEQHECNASSKGAQNENISIMEQLEMELGSLLEKIILKIVTFRNYNHHKLKTLRT